MVLAIVIGALLVSVAGLYFTGQSALRLSISLAVAIFLLGILVPVFRWDILSVHLRYVFPVAALATVIFVILHRRAGFAQSWRDSRWPAKAVTVAGPVAALLLVVPVWLVPAPATRVELAPPLKEGRFFVVQGGNHKTYNHHFDVPAQKYALDLTAITPLGRHVAGWLAGSLADYAVYGATVHAPCNGEVTAARLAVSEDDTAYAAGNYVALHCEAVTVLLAHLQPELLVAEGDTLIAGQAVGKVGNSGNSTEPHLHIHAVRGRVTDTDQLLWRGEGLPMSFSGAFLWRNDLMPESPA